ncbi:MAG: hypothetical protein V8T10_03650 [Merdibacter sp.]
MTMETPSNFVMLLRKQLDGGFIRRSKQVRRPLRAAHRCGSAR